ncbi:MAG: hypothetical protein PGN33_01470 [Methylobacterium radiotolerans]
MNFQRSWNNHIFVHLGWIIALLIISIIGLLSSQLGTNNNVKDILNFAVSLTSLFLAAFAIVQSLLAGTALPDAVSEVRRAIAEVKIPADRLSAAADIIENHAGKMSQQAENIGDIANQFASRQLLFNSSASEDKEVGFDISKEALEAAPSVFLLGLHLMLKSYETKSIYVDHSITSSNQDTMNIVGCISALLALGIIDTDYSGPSEFYVSDIGKFSWLLTERNWIFQTGQKSPMNSDWFVKRYLEIDAFYAPKMLGTASTEGHPT